MLDCTAFSHFRPARRSAIRATLMGINADSTEPIGPCGASRKDRNRAKAQRRVARAFAHVADARQDYLHKLTTRLVRENQTIVVEGLHVRGMVRNHNRACAIHDAAWYERFGGGAFHRTDERQPGGTGDRVILAVHIVVIEGDGRIKERSSAPFTGCTGGTTRTPRGSRVPLGGSWPSWATA